MPKTKTVSPWNKLYTSIYVRCNYTDNSYSRKGIKCRIKPSEIKILWYRYKAYLMKRPSIHRKDHSKHYTIDNCVFIEYEKHIPSYPVNQYSKDGELLKTYKSINEACRKNNLDDGNLTKLLQGKRKFAFTRREKNRKKESIAKWRWAYA